MHNGIRFPYTSVDDLNMMPRLSLTLAYQNRAVEVTGLLDTGSAINVLPYSVGLALGAHWDEQTMPVQLVGSLGRYEARALVVDGLHPTLIPNSSVRLVFAWTQAEDTPLLFGQMNFFMEFDVCFYRSQSAFEIHRK